VIFRYRYQHRSGPPAPYVLVNLSHPDGSASLDDQPAKVDTGADRTVIPEAVAAALALDAVDVLEVEGLDGTRIRLPTSFVVVTIRAVSPVTVAVLRSPGEPEILLGRDVLNHFRIVLDGPDLALEISAPAT
jgi:predicted aspartyl protease